MRNIIADAPSAERKVFKRITCSHRTTDLEKEVRCMDLFKPGMLGILSNLVRICSLHVCAKFSAENGQVEPCFENPGKGRKYYGNPNELAIKLLGTNKVNLQLNFL